MRCEAKNVGIPDGIARLFNDAARPSWMSGTDPISVFQWTRCKAGERWRVHYHIAHHGHGHHPMLPSAPSASSSSRRKPDRAHRTRTLDATGVGWVYEYALVDRSGHIDIGQLRALNDWFLKFELQPAH